MIYRFDFKHFALPYSTKTNYELLWRSKAFIFSPFAFQDDFERSFYRYITARTTVVRFTGERAVYTSYRNQCVSNGWRGFNYYLFRAVRGYFLTSRRKRTKSYDQWSEQSDNNNSIAHLFIVGMRAHDNIILRFVLNFTGSLKPPSFWLGFTP